MSKKKKKESLEEIELDIIFYAKYSQRYGCIKRVSGWLQRAVSGVDRLFLLSNAVSALLPGKVVMGAACRPLNFKYMSYWQIRGKSAV